MPKIKCDWTFCRHNTSCELDTEEIGECQFEGEVILLCVEDDKENEHLECQQFEWGEDA
jgi:hypothetical protein